MLTVKGLECIKKADCIIYDRLASPELLKYAKAGCELIYAGKQNHHHTLKQEEINRLLVEKAMEYSQVVRLKGGDVFVFGRGGEEGIYMAERGVSFEVVPGVTSAVAGLAYAGIPITHRGVAAGFHVVTAHSKDDELADLDFEAMAKSSDTCVFLMGLGKLGEIAQKLMEAGMPGTTKAAVVSHGTTPEQRVCTAPLSEIAAAVEKEGLTSPALIAVGEVVGLREQLNFYETKPAFGKHYLVPKIGEGVSGLTELLKEQGAAVTEVMTGKIERCRLSFEKEQLKKADWLIFTSRNGVESFFAALAEKGLDTRALAGSRIAIIGEKTAKALAEKGIRADLLPDSYHSDALIEALKKVLKKEDTVWYIRAEKVESRLAEELSGSCIWKELTGYKNTVADQEMPSEEELLSYDGIFFTCASSARRLLEGRDSRFLEKLCKKVNVYSIGQNVRKA